MKKRMTKSEARERVLEAFRQARRKGVKIIVPISSGADATLRAQLQVPNMNLTVLRPIVTELVDEQLVVMSKTEVRRVDPVSGDPKRCEAMEYTLAS